MLERGSPLVTFGIRASHPETGYGWIERGAPLDEGLRAWHVARFHEKPSAEKAQEYCQAGRFYWNSGIFLFSAAAIAEQLRALVPGMAPTLNELRRDLRSGAGDKAWARYFEAAPAVSIDHGVMERAGDVAVVEADFDWNDLGTWTSWGDLKGADAAGDRVQGDVLAVDTGDSILYSEEGGLLAVLGVKDLIVVRVKDATLVCSKERAQEVRRLVQEGNAHGLFRRYF